MAKLDRHLVRERLYEQVATVLREQVLPGCAVGDRLPAERALAAQFGVSVMTVREALCALAQAGLIERRHGSGNFVLEPTGGRHVAIVNELDLTQPFRPYFFLRVAQALQDRLSELGIASHHYIGHTRHGDVPPPLPTNEHLLQNLDASKISAIATISTWASPPFLKRIHEAGLAILGSAAEDDYRVLIDYERMVDDGVACLASHGCRRIGLFNLHRPEAEAPSPLHQRFVAALDRHGLISAGAHAAFPETPLPGHRAETLFLRQWDDPRTRPDGLLVLDEVLFQEIAFAMLGRGIRVGEDIQVVTHTNKGSNVFGQLPVTKLEVDPEAFAHALADMVAALLQNRLPAPRQVTLQATPIEPSLSRTT